MMSQKERLQFLGTEKEEKTTLLPYLITVPIITDILSRCLINDHSAYVRSYCGGSSATEL